MLAKIFSNSPRPTLGEKDFIALENAITLLANAMSAETQSRFLDDMKKVDPELYEALERQASEAVTLDGFRRDLCQLFLAKVTEMCVHISEDPTNQPVVAF